MKDEILAAVVFLLRFAQKNEKFPRDKEDAFKSQLIECLTERFKNHWFPDCPAKGQGYRCIRVNELHPVDRVLQKAAMKVGLSYNDLQLPIELTLWVDPKEVCCRFGESEGSYCTLATFSDKENQLILRSSDITLEQSTINNIIQIASPPTSNNNKSIDNNNKTTATTILENRNRTTPPKKYRKYHNTSPPTTNYYNKSMNLQVNNHRRNGVAATNNGNNTQQPPLQSWRTATNYYDILPHFAMPTGNFIPSNNNNYRNNIGGGYPRMGQQVAPPFLMA